MIKGGFYSVSQFSPHLYQLNCASSSWKLTAFKGYRLNSKQTNAFADFVFNQKFSLLLFISVSFIGRIWPCICKSLNNQEIQNLPTHHPCSLFLQSTIFQRVGVAALCTDQLPAGEIFEVNQENCKTLILPGLSPPPCSDETYVRHQLLGL